MAASPLPVAKRFGRYLLELNAFQSDSTEKVQVERWATRIFLVLFLVGVVGVFIYASKITYQTTVVVLRPSYATVDDLRLKYTDSVVKCPCTKSAIPRASFTKINIVHHQICSSSFVGDEWIRAVFSNNMSGLGPIDARVVASSQAQMLRWLCVLGVELGKAAIALEYAYPSINAKPVYSKDFSDIIETMRRDMLGGELALIPLVLQMLSTFTSGNGYVSALGTNVVARTANDTPDRLAFSTASYQLDNGDTCDCHPTASCPVPAAVNTSLPVKGMRSNCYPFDGLLASTLECYFDASCLKLLVPDATPFQPLDAQRTGHFPATMSLSLIAGQSMIEDIRINGSMDDYFSQCDCAKCSYDSTFSNTWLGVVSVGVGLMSGVNTALRLLIPILIGLSYKLLMRKRKGPVPTVSESTPRPDICSKETVRRLWRLIKTLNLFNSHSNDPRQTQREIQSTRLYLVLVSTAFIVLALFNALVQRSYTYSVSNPSYERFVALKERYGNAVRCDCRTSEYVFRDLVSIDVTYHPICSSEFVSQRFINQLFRIKSTPMHERDFVTMSGMYFKAIAKYCDLIRGVVDYKRWDALNGGFVYSHLVDDRQFNQAIVQFINDFRNASLEYINADLAELLDFLINTHSLSASQTSTILPITSNGTVLIQPVDLDNCSCLLHPRVCSTEAGFYSYESLNHSFNRVSKPMGIRVGCSSFYSMFHSNLACWYSSECYDQVTAYWQERLSAFSIRPALLDATDLHHFHVSDTLQTIIEQGMIDQLRNKSNFSAYVNFCQPELCTYSLFGHPSALIFIINLFGTWSGLNVIAKLLSPILIYMVHWCLQRTRECVSIGQKLSGIPSSLRALNLFHKRFSSSAATLKLERRSTRLYLVSWCCIFAMILYYNLTFEETTYETLNEPKESDFVEFRRAYGSVVNCQCSRKIVLYGTFSSRSARLHQVCTSQYVQTAWIESILNSGARSNLVQGEFRTYALGYFLTLRYLCESAQRTVQMTEWEISNRGIWKSGIITRDELIAGIYVVMNQTIVQRIINFKTLLLTGRGLTHGNQLMDVFSSNWMFSPIDIHQPMGSRVQNKPSFRGSNCSCSVSSDCTEPVLINGQLVPGFVQGCSALDSVLRSTLICLYDQKCLDLINVGHSSLAQPLALSAASRFTPNSTVQDLVEYGFQEGWSLHADYSQFVSECASDSCTYAVPLRKTAIEIVTLILSLYGGLTLILRFIVPRVFRLISNSPCIARLRKDQVVPAH